MQNYLMSIRSLQHFNPIWRERTNYILGIQINDTDANGNHLWEQVWAQKTAYKQYILCCIPMFVYGYSLGDAVLSMDGKWVTCLVQPSEYDTIRIWFHIESPDICHQVMKYLTEMQCLTEWYSKRLLAAAVPRKVGCDFVLTTLQSKWSEEYIEIEIGSSHTPD